MTSLFVIPEVRFTCAATQSKKNSGKVVRYGTRYGYRPNQVALDQEAMIRDHLDFVIPEPPHFGDREVAVVIQYDARADVCEVLVSDLGPRPKGFAGRRRDLANLGEVILDALQGPVIVNDNQVCELRFRRLLR